MTGGSGALGRGSRTDLDGQAGGTALFEIPQYTKMDWNRPILLLEWFDRGFFVSEICVVFEFPCRRDLWFLVFACSVLHWNVKFPPGSQVWQPKE